MKIEGKVLAVTGAGNGVGRAVERNAYRVLIGRDAKMMDALDRVNPSGAAALIARQMQGLTGS